MASGIVNWIRRSISDHDDVRASRSLPHQLSADAASAPANDSNRPQLSPVGESGEEKNLGGKKQRSISTSQYKMPPLLPAGSKQSTASPSSFFEDDFDDGMPEVVGKSNIMSDSDIARLAPLLPSRKVGATWRLAFDSDADGFSLQSLYRRVDAASRSQAGNCPSLLVIRDTGHRRFGAVVPDAFRIQEREKFYGSGETFVFRLGEEGDSVEAEEGEFRVWKFAHTNYYVIFCSHEMLSVGSGDGKPAIQVDSDLNKGRSDHCPTYSNDPLVPEADFTVSNLEVWIFD